MKKILLTNNSQLASLIDSHFDKIYTDSPFVVENYNYAIYLDTLLDQNFDKTINNIRKKGYEINKKIINSFFPTYQNQNIDILNIRVEFTNIYINIFKLLKLIELYPNDEITIGISNDELYDYDSPEALEGYDNRFANIYYWIADLVKIKSVKLLCKDIKSDLSIGHSSTLDSWFLRLIDLDKKVLVFNFLKKLGLINKNKKKIYLYKKNITTREIEPYLHDLGYSLIFMPEIRFKYERADDLDSYQNVIDVLDIFFENNSLNNIFKSGIYEMYKKRIKYYIQKELYTKNYISKLDKSIKIILTNTISGFDSHIFAKQLQEKGYKIINIMHGLSTAFRREKDLDFFECEVPDVTMCFNNSERNMYKKLVPNSLLYPISVVQEAKKKRVRFLKRLRVNKLLKINSGINIFYPSDLYPHNNVTIHGFQLADKLKHKFEKKMIKILANVNKRAIYKHYPMRSYVDPNPLIKYAQKFKNIKVIDKTFDFRFISSLGDIFILGNVGTSSTLTWMIGENKPIIFLYTNKSRFLNEEGKKILEKIFIFVNIDEDDWILNLTNILNKPYSELVKIWKDKQIHRDHYDEEWLMGTNLHAGKLASNYIEKFISEKKL